MYIAMHVLYLIQIQYPQYWDMLSLISFALSIQWWQCNIP